MAPQQDASGHVPTGERDNADGGAPARQVTRRRWVTVRHVARALVVVGSLAVGVAGSWAVTLHADQLSAVLAVGRGAFFGAILGICLAAQIPLPSGANRAEVRDLLQGNDVRYDRDRPETADG